MEELFPPVGLPATASAALSTYRPSPRRVRRPGSGKKTQVEPGRFKGAGASQSCGERFSFLGSVSKQTAPESTNNSRSGRLEPGESRRQRLPTTSQWKQKSAEVCVHRALICTQNARWRSGGGGGSSGTVLSLEKKFCCLNRTGRGVLRRTCISYGCSLKEIPGEDGAESGGGAQAPSVVQPCSDWSGDSEQWRKCAVGGCRLPATITIIRSASPPCQRSDIRTGAEEKQPAALSSHMTATRKTRNGSQRGRESARRASLRLLIL